MQWWKVIIGVVMIGALGGLGWYVARPVPGLKMEEQGREHVSAEKVASFQYNSNPPTSGQHLPTWVKAGVYETPQSEGELIHALEHGYVVMSYNCNIHLKNQRSKIKDQKYRSKIQNIIAKDTFAHEEDGGEGSPSADFVDSTIATGSAVNETDACKSLVGQLKKLAEGKKLWKLIVVPRPQLDTTLALTAWDYIDKFDPPAGGFEVSRIERFIDFHRDQGPEKTME